MLFYFKGPAESVTVGREMAPLALSKFSEDEWGAALVIPDIDRVLATVQFNAAQSGGGSTNAGTIKVAGKLAAPIYPKGNLHGVKSIPLPSEHLGSTRAIHVWLPPGYTTAVKYPVIYVADGAVMLARTLEPRIVSGTVRPVIVVAINDCGNEMVPGAMSCRANEYVDLPAAMMGLPDAYQRHEKFVLNEVIPFVERSYSVSTNKKDRAVAGFSSGADWAASIAMRNPGVFGGAIVMSPMISVYRNASAKLEGTFFITAGYLDAGAMRAAPCLGSVLAKRGADFRITKVPYGHSQDSNELAFANDAALWLAGKPAASGPFIAPAAPCRTFD